MQDKSKHRRYHPKSNSIFFIPLIPAILLTVLLFAHSVLVEFYGYYAFGTVPTFGNTRYAPFEDTPSEETIFYHDQAVVYEWLWQFSSVAWILTGLGALIWSWLWISRKVINR